MEESERMEKGEEIVVIGFRKERKKGYGRMIEEGGKIVEIIEEKEEKEEKKKIGLWNGGIMELRGKKEMEMIDEVGNENEKGEY